MVVAEAPAVLEAFGKKIIQTLPSDGVMYKYKYNGKEYQDELGLNFYDYGARNYDPRCPKSIIKTKRYQN
jgi:RHS repeat-associated protein